MGKDEPDAVIASVNDNTNIAPTPLEEDKE